MRKENGNNRIEESIRRSAENVPIPESLHPENIRRQLEEQKAIEEEKIVVGHTEPDAGRAKGRAIFGRRLRSFYGAAAAALLFVCCGVMLHFGLQAQKSKESTAEGAKPESYALVMDEGSEEQESVISEGAGQEDVIEAAEEFFPDGALYRRASDYGEVYDAIMRNAGDWIYWTEEMPAADLEEVGISQPSNSDGATFSGGLDKAEYSAAESRNVKTEYSGTNLQVQGVDESDIVKLDGSYLYIVKKDGVHIVDIRSARMKETAVILLPPEAVNGIVRELYVDNNMLSLIVCRLESDLREKEQEEKAYYVDTKCVTSLYTYDITDRTSPQPAGGVSQEGNYYTSRKIGDMIYLFSENNMYDACYDTSRQEEQWVPDVNGEMIAADRIYIPERGQSGLIISSVNLKKPSEIVDNVMILNDYVNIYVTAQSVYLYNEVYDYGWASTQIARFGLKDGRITPAATASVSGYVRDTFAVNESGDSFRVLTTDNSGNCLYLFDLNLQPTGSLTGIAPGEMIYAARYLEDIVYFVTYRNTDPLFAVDLSDASAPKLLGELKITGYSDYLHVWKEDTLLGLGYETDPDTGSIKGLKLAMFDVSDPVRLQTLDSMVIKNMDFSPALDNYKCVLAEPGANLIGFAARENYSSAEGWKGYYLLFGWQDGKFCSLLTEEMEGFAEGDLLASCRGLYAGDMFYLVNPDEIISFDRKDGYRETDRLVLE